MAWDDDLQGPGLQFAGSQSNRLRALAGPGTGKTHALLRRLTRVIEGGNQPDELLVLTFARTAAADIVDKLHNLQDARFDDVKARTLHAFSFGVLASQGFLQASNRVSRIVLEFERDYLLRDLDGRFGHTLTDRRELTLAFEAAWARLQVDHPGQPVHGLEQAFQDALLASLQWHQGMLIGEVVPLTLAYLRQNPNAPERHGYAHVLVDEYQDLNRAEQTLVDFLSENCDLAVIGDDDQSIYRFKHANPEGIREFTAVHQGAEDVQFTECRRCPQSVVTLAQTIIQRNPGRVRGPLVARPGNPIGEIHNVQWRSIEEEAEGLATFVQHKVNAGIDPGSCLILSASKRIGFAVRDAVQATGIEIRSFFREEAVETEAAQERLTLLTLLANPDDRIALRGWIGLGSDNGLSASYKRLAQAARERGTGVKEVLEEIVAGNLTIPFSTHPVARWQELQNRLAQLEPLRDNIPALIDAVLPDIADADPENDHALLRRVVLSCIPEVDAVEELPNMIRYRIGQPDVPLETSYARVMSFHKSKGLTARLVILAGQVDGLMPRIDPDDTLDEQRADLEEQRRLFFVGMTRTTDILVFSSYSQLPTAVAQQLRVRRGAFIPGGAGAYRVFASPFLEETGPTLPGAVRGVDWHY